MHNLQRDDQFLIFASDGLWEKLSNQEAFRTIRDEKHNPNFSCSQINFIKMIKVRMLMQGKARKRLVKVAKKREMRYSDLNLGLKKSDMLREA